MRIKTAASVLIVSHFAVASWPPVNQVTGDASSTNRTIPVTLFTELERLSRLADIAYCVAPPAAGISKPFGCLSHCAEFPDFELVTAWNTGPLLSDTAGYIALDHATNKTSSGQVVVAFRGTYSIANAVVDLSTIPQEYAPYPGDDDGEEEIVVPPALLAQGRGAFRKHDKCDNCTVHMGFNTAWLNTRKRILHDLFQAFIQYPDYDIVLIGHSLGGAVAMLAALELKFRGFEPLVTTFGEPRVGNKGLVQYLDRHYHLKDQDKHGLVMDNGAQYRRLTHVDDPVPLLPLSEWGYEMHAGEIFISKRSLSPDIADLQFCSGDNDRDCIAGQDGTAPDETLGKRGLVQSVRQEIIDVKNEPWGIPSRYKLWELFFAHRDYFHRIGLCVPGGDPMGGGKEYQQKKDL